MKKFFSIFSMSFLLISNIFGQAAVDIPLIATTNTDSFLLSVGIDLTATNCIDPQLGEADLISPPPGYTEIRFDLYPYGCGPLSTYKDYRSPGNPPVFPFTGIIEHTLWWETNGSPIDITYNIPTGATIQITDQIGGGFLNIGPFTGQGTATIPSSYTSIFVRALLIMEYENIVPVELTSFTVSVLQNDKAVQLNWTTATETNNSGFEILRLAQNDNEWKTIGFIPGFGTTAEPKSYSFVDDLSLTPNLTHILRYRLKQIDFDGSFEYSNEIEVEVDFTPKEFVLYQNYPNPFNPTTIIKYEIPSVTLRQAQSDIMVSLKVYDILGNEVVTLINEEKQPGVYEVEFDASSLASGMYLYKLQAGMFVQTKKMILVY